MPQLALAVAAAEVAGTVATAYGVAAGSAVAFGMTAGQLGFAIGSVAGSILFAPTQKASGPRLADLKAPQVAYGSTIPYIEGHPRLAGNVVWASEKREIQTTTQQGGKGGGGAEVTTFTYEMDVMYMLSENVVAALRRVWWNGELVYTRADGADLESLQSEEERWSRLTFYSGAADQLPDPTYEAAIGVGSAPAYRGRSCVFIEGLQLGAGGQLPNLTFEVSAGDGGQLGASARLVWSLPVEETYLSSPPQGAYASGPTVAIPEYTPQVEIAALDAASVFASLPEGAYAGAPARGNSAEAVVGYGPIVGVPYLYLVGDGISQSIAIPDSNDFLGSADIRFSRNAGWIAVGSALDLAEGVGTWSGCTGHQGDVYVFNTAGTHQHTIAHGAPVQSVAALAGYVYALSGSTLKEYETDGWTLSDTIALPTGSGHRIFPSSDGYLCCANGAGEIYKYIEAVWSLFATLEDDDVDLGTGNAVHHCTETEAFATVLTVVEGVSIPEYRWIDSAYDPNTADDSLFFVTLNDCVNSRGETWASSLLTVGGQPRATRNFAWTETDREDVIIDMGTYTYVEHVETLNTIERYYGYPLDVTSPGYYETTETGDFYRVLYRMTAQLTTSLDTYRAWSVDLVPLTEPTLQAVVERQCERAGLDLDYVDASDLATRNVRAMVVSQITSPRAVIEMLSSAYFFSSVESEILRFSFRGGASVASVGYDELVTADDDPLPIVKANDLELPVQVFIKYSNLNDDYQDGSESSDRLISSGQNTAQAELPLGFMPEEAKRIADGQLMDAAASVLRFGPFSLTRDYARLEPSDVVTLEDSAGTLFRARVTRKSEAAGVLTFDAVSDNAAAVASAAQTSASGYANSTGITLPIDTEALLLDMPILSDAHNDAGFYLAAHQASGERWPGCALMKSVDGATYASAARQTAAAVIGETTTILGVGVANLFDEGSFVTVNVGDGELASYARDAILAGTAPGYLIGNELLFARTATLDSPGVYTLSGLLRGRRGTEWAMGTHAAGERVVLLTPTTVARVPMSNAELGLARSWKAVSIGRSSDTAAAESFTDNGVGLKPYSPVDLRVARDASSNITLTLKRRTRLATRFCGSLGISVPLGEESESYEVDVYATSGYATVKRTLSASSPSLAYTAAQQTTDFGSAQPTIYAKAYQRSASVGRGYALTAQG